MKNPLDIINRFRDIITELRRRNEKLDNERRQACRAEALYKDSLIEERERNWKLMEKNEYLNRRLEALQQRERSLQEQFRKRLWQAHNPQVSWDSKRKN